MTTATSFDPAVFTEINNALLDLQGSSPQTFSRPLKLLARLLNSPGLSEINETLKSRVDFDAFISASERTGGSMVGSHELLWPEDKEDEFGLTLILIEKMAAQPNWAIDVGHTFFYTDSYIISGIHSITSQVLIPFVRDYKTYLSKLMGATTVRTSIGTSRKVFIVHGHDDAAREAVARFLERTGFEPVILHEQANRGMTVAEKLDAYGTDIGFAVVLLTPDDVGRSASESELSPRARQNVLLELGYFVGRLGRDRVCALKKGDVEIPSDYVGVVYTALDDAGAWKAELGRELQAAGHTIDWNKVMGA